MTKAEKMFRANRIECEAHIKNWGYEINPNGKAVGFNTIATSDDDHICTRTLNDIMKLVEAARRQTNLSLKYGVIDSEKYTLRMNALNMVESTVENSRKVLASIK